MENDRILDMRRIVIKPKKVKIPNPEFDEVCRRTKEYAESKGLPYTGGRPEFIMGFEDDITETRTHVEYKLVCTFCGTATWMRRRDSKFCTSGCRTLHYNKLKREKEAQEQLSQLNTVVKLSRPGEPGNQVKVKVKQRPGKAFNVKIVKDRRDILARYRPSVTVIE